MEEEKAAAYYDELTRKGEGAARFKQGLGFCSSASNDGVPSRGSALSSSSFLGKFVRASSPSKTNELEKQAPLESIQSKLKKKPKEAPFNSSSRVSRESDRGNRNLNRRSRSRSRSRSRTRYSKRRSRSRSRSRSRDGDWRSRRRSSSWSRDSDRKSRRRSRSLSRDSDRDRRSKRRSGSRSRGRDRYRSRSRSRDSYKARQRERSRSRETERLHRKKRSTSESPPPRRKVRKENGRDGAGTKVDYGKLIEAYDTMTPAERVKAKMKLQLSETADKDETKGVGSGWERFNFDKDAPLDDEEIEAAEDDTVIVKRIGQSFRYSAVEARREDEIKAAHDEAMFGAPSLIPSAEIHDEREDIKSSLVASFSSEDVRDAMEEESKKDASQSAPVSNLISAQALMMQQGSWRDRVRKL